MTYFLIFFIFILYVYVCVRDRERREGERRLVFLRSDDWGFPLLFVVVY